MRTSIPTSYTSSRKTPLYHSFWLSGHRLGTIIDSTMSGDDIEDILRESLKGVTKPGIRLITLEHGSVFINLPPDLETERQKLREELGEIPIPPVVDVKSWMKQPSENSTIEDSQDD